MIKKQRITRETVIYRNYPLIEEMQEPEKNRFFIGGELEWKMIYLGLSIPLKEFLERFPKPNNLKKGLKGVLEIEDSKGTYIFYEKTRALLREWRGVYGGLAKLNVIDFSILEIYLNPSEHLKKYREVLPPLGIVSEGIENVKMQKNLVLMLKKYVNSINNYYTPSQKR